MLEIANGRPGLVEPYQLLAAIAMKEQRLADAASYYTRIIAMLDNLKDPRKQRRGALENLAKAHSDLAIVLQKLGELPGAIEHSEQALRIKPNYAESHFNLGNFLQQLGKLPEAIGHYEQALRMNPDYAEAHLNLGNALVQIGNLPEAREHYGQAVRIRPDDAVIHYNLAAALELEGDTAEALAQYAEAIRIQADFVSALNRLAWIRATTEDSRLRDGSEAVHLAEHADQLTGHRDADALVALAAAYAEVGRFAEAMQTANQARQFAKDKESIRAQIRLYEAGQAFSRVAAVARQDVNSTLT